MEVGDILDYTLILAIILIIITFYTVNYQFLIFLSVISFCSIYVFKAADIFTYSKKLIFFSILSLTGIIGFPFLTAYRMSQTSDAKIASNINIFGSVGIIIAVVTISLIAITNSPEDSYFFEIFSNTIGILALRLTDKDDDNEKIRLTDKDDNEKIRRNIGKLMWIILTGIYATSASNTFITIHTKPVAK
jgi:hypothetical protein